MKVIPFPKRSTRSAPCPTRQRLEQARQILMEGLKTDERVQTLEQVADRLEKLVDRLEAWLLKSE